MKNYFILEEIFLTKNGEASIDFLEGRGFDGKYIMYLEQNSRGIKTFGILEYEFYFQNDYIIINKKTTWQ